jgi:hypothetical protein
LLFLVIDPTVAAHWPVVMTDLPVANPALRARRSQHSSSHRSANSRSVSHPLGRGTLLVIGATLGHCYHQDSLHKA